MSTTSRPESADHQSDQDRREVSPGGKSEQRDNGLYTSRDCRQMGYAAKDKCAANKHDA
jgi:hypothetical protein